MKAVELEMIAPEGGREGYRFIEGWDFLCNLLL